MNQEQFNEVVIDSAVMQLAELRKEHAEMCQAICTGRWADALDIATRHTVIV